jgi:hypothetical protein
MLCTCYTRRSIRSQAYLCCRFVLTHCVQKVRLRLSTDRNERTLLLSLLAAGITRPYSGPSPSHSAVLLHRSRAVRRLYHLREHAGCERSAECKATLHSVDDKHPASEEKHALIQQCKCSNTLRQASN